MDIAVWNVLHDGEVTAVEGSIPGDLRLSISIAYLCGQLRTRSDLMVITLTNCERLEYQPYDAPPTYDRSTIAGLSLVLLSATSVDGLIRVECADGGYGGSLLMQYSSAWVATADGEPLSQEVLESAAERYWNLWRQKHGEQSDAVNPASPIVP